MSGEKRKGTQDREVISPKKVKNMASLTFQPYVDKENASVMGFQSRKAMIKNGGLGMKSKKITDENFATPRKALGDVNKENRSLKVPGLKQVHPNTLKPLNGNSSLVTPRKALGNINKDPKAASIKTPSLKSLNPFIKPSTSKSENVKVKQTSDTNKKAKIAAPIFSLPQGTPSQVPEKEQMFIPKDDDEDDFEDIMPKSERISTYISKLISWRPPCFGNHPFSDDEEGDNEDTIAKQAEEIVQRLSQNLPDTEPPETEMNVEDLWVTEPLDEIPFPSADITLDSINPSMDDSVDITSNIGGLHLHDIPASNT